MRDPERLGRRISEERESAARGEEEGKKRRRKAMERRGVVTENVRRIVVRGLGKGALPKVVKMQTTGSSRVLDPKLFLLY